MEPQRRKERYESPGLMEWIYNMKSLVNNHTVVQVFGEQGRASGLKRGRDDQAVPESEVVPFSDTGRFKVGTQFDRKNSACELGYAVNGLIIDNLIGKTVFRSSVQ